MSRLVTIKRGDDGDEEQYRLCVCQVEESRSDGSPLRLRVICEDESVPIKGGEFFITAFIPECNFHREQKDDGGS